MTRLTDRLLMLLLGGLLVFLAMGWHGERRLLLAERADLAKWEARVLAYSSPLIADHLAKGLAWEFRLLPESRAASHADPPKKISRTPSGTTP